MTDSNSDKINSRLSKSREAFDVAILSLENRYLNTAVSRLYYTCFHLVTALFAKYDIVTYTHNGVKTVFSKSFIKDKKIEPKWGSC